MLKMSKNDWVNFCIDTQIGKFGDFDNTVDSLIEAVLYWGIRKESYKESSIPPAHIAVDTPSGYIYHFSLIDMRADGDGFYTYTYQFKDLNLCIDNLINVLVFISK